MTVRRFLALLAFATFAIVLAAVVSRPILSNMSSSIESRRLLRAEYEVAEARQAFRAGVTGDLSEDAAAKAFSRWYQYEPLVAEEAAKVALENAAAGVNSIRHCGPLEDALLAVLPPGDSESVRVVRGLFGRSATEFMSNTCGLRLLQRLRAWESVEWGKYPFTYNGWNIFGTMIGGRISELRLRDRRFAEASYASRSWRLSSNDSLDTELTEFMLEYGEKEIQGGRDIYVSFDRAIFDSPSHARAKYIVLDYRRGPPVGRLEVVLEPVGSLPEQPWTIVEIVEATILDQ